MNGVYKQCMHEFKFALYDVCKVYGTSNYYIFLFQYKYNMSNICSYNITSIQQILNPPITC